MTKNIVSLILSLIFVALLVAPTIIVMVDDSIDVSLFFDSSEEEEKGSEKNKDIEILVFEDFHCEFDFDSSEEENNLEYFFKNYPKPHLNLISPPPEHILYI